MPGISLETIHANHGYAGSDFVHSETMRFDGVLICFSTLSLWLGCSGLNVDLSSPGFDISWRQPPQISCNVRRSQDFDRI